MVLIVINQSLRTMCLFFWAQHEVVQLKQWAGIGNGTYCTVIADAIWEWFESGVALQTKTANTNCLLKKKKRNHLEIAKTSQLNLQTKP